jgi:hypothetical protein
MTEQGSLSVGVSGVAEMTMRVVGAGSGLEGGGWGRVG